MSAGSNIWGPSPYVQYDVSSGVNNFKTSNKTPGALSTSSQTTYEDDHYQYDWGANRGISRRNTKENIEVSSGNTLLNRRRQALNEKKEHGRETGGHNSPLNTSGSSITEEIFNTALSNLEFLSDEEPNAVEE